METMNLFEELDKLDKDAIQKMVDVMLLPAEARLDYLMALEDPEKAGLFYAAYGRYIVHQKPYSPLPEDRGAVIGGKISAITEMLCEDDPSPLYLWALDSAILTDITVQELSEHTAEKRQKDVTQAFEESDERERSYDH